MRDDPRMDPIEESVRRALEGGNPADQVFRRSIYAASRRAMERMISQRALAGPEAEAERARVSTVIDRVEGEYAAYYGGDGYHPDEADAPAGAQDLGGSSERADDPAHAHTGARSMADGAPADQAARQTRPPASFAPPPASARAGSEESAGWRPGATSSARTGSTRRKPGRPVVLALLFILAIAALLIVGRFLLAGGDAQTTSVTQSQAPTQSATGPLSWIDVFSGASLEQVSTPAGGRVTSVEDAGRPAIRISGPDGADAEILINLGPGLVREIAGADVRVELVAGSPDGEQREFAVRCLFGQDSVCERQRFATSMPEEAFVFDVTVPGGAGSPANLAIEPGLAGSTDVDVFSVRMRVL